jgi:Skp family chaperone for outer membrane proteins
MPLESFFEMLMAESRWLTADSCPITRHLIIGCLFLALGAGCAAKANIPEPPQEQKIGVVDLLAVAERTQAGARLLAVVRAEAAQFNRKIGSERQQLDQQLESGQITAEEHQARHQRLNRDAQTVQTELQQKRKRVLSPLHAKVATLVKGMAEQEGFTMVLVKGRPESMMITWHATPELDFTERVIEAINRQYP